MVTRETNYIGQLYFGLSTDDPADVAEWHNGDRILLMDQDKMMVYDEAAFDFHEIPMGGGGGGGGGGSDLELLTTGTYVLTSDSNMVTIPVTVPPGKKVQRIIADTDVISGTASTYAWFRDYTMPQYVTDLIPRINMAKTNSVRDYTAIYGDQLTTSNSGASCYMADRTTGTNFAVLRVSSAFPCKAGTYRWSLYGGAL